jgi:hypothetical protein
MHYGNARRCQDDLISVAQFDLDHQKNIRSPQTLRTSSLSLSIYQPVYMKQLVGPGTAVPAVQPHMYCLFTSWLRQNLHALGLCVTHLACW